MNSGDNDDRAEHSSDAERLFAELLAEAGAEEMPDIEALCAGHPEQATELRRLHGEVGRLLHLIRQRVSGSLSDRIREQFGSDVDPGISLEDEDTVEADTDFSSIELDRLADRSGDKPRYRVKGEVARGGMGMVLRVWDQDLRRHLAMKVMLERGGLRPDPDEQQDASRSLSRFLEEAQVTGQLDHPGIVPVHELGLDASGRVFFTMKFVKGRDLRAVFDLTRRGEAGWNRTRVLGVVLKVCEAMAYAHEKGVIHRDLKPGNVMVGRFGAVYVMDWGLARVLGEDDRKDIRIQEPMLTSEVRSDRRDQAASAPDSELVTMDGDVVGTPAYMSPEQAAGRPAELTPSTDVYSVGALLYHLLSGQRPYIPPGAAVNNYAIWVRIQEGPPRPLHEIAPDVPPELTSICEKAMAREVADRYPGMQELAEDLRAYLEGHVVRAYETGAWAEARKWVRRNRRFAAALVAAIVLLVAGLVASLALGHRASENARIAADNAQTAKQQEGIARVEKDNVMRLSAFQDLRDLQERAERLWPAHPQHLDAYDEWLADARELVAGLNANPETDDAGHLARRAQLRDRALPRTQEDLERDRRTHPRIDEFERLEGRLESLQRARRVREGTLVPEGHLPPSRTEGSPASILNTVAWILVAPRREIFGSEGLGLTLARRARDKARGPERAMTCDTLAWALFANGLDGEAVEAAREAVELAPDGAEEQYGRSLERIERQVAQVEETLATAEAEVVSLSEEVSRRRTWRLASDEDTWWHDQVEKLVIQIEALVDPETGLIDGVSPEFGWGITRRKAWAERVAELTRDGPEARAAWSEAIGSIADPMKCRKYLGLEIRRQLGLLPLGLDFDSGLWEFAHPQTGQIPERDRLGRLVMTEESCLVFVLIPGGTALQGAQPVEAAAVMYDEDALAKETPVHRVPLSPFFLSKFEMTQGQWLRLTGVNPSIWTPENEPREVRDLLHPVENVSWLECERLCRRLGLSLPSEAQWERACRAGTYLPFSWPVGAEPLRYANVADLSWKARHHEALGWEEFDDGFTLHAPVGRLLPNSYGLHDMHGNIYEWCLDAYDEAYYTKTSLPGVTSGSDPVNDSTDTRYRVTRGGSLFSPLRMARSANRSYQELDFTYRDLGLRPARALEE